MILLVKQHAADAVTKFVVLRDDFYLKGTSDASGHDSLFRRGLRIENCDHQGCNGDNGYVLRCLHWFEVAANFSRRLVYRDWMCPKPLQISLLSVKKASPENRKFSIDRAAATSWPDPHASVTMMGM